ncbi:DUF6318 family protein [Nocardioides alpinus]|uniref:DUF6318 family protein n=1 Tax=Nocardioides alpinus TaxID=748909 RepID=UPI0011142321|nr:DUF6318 family protein [Nocardioides alpinus]
MLTLFSEGSFMHVRRALALALVVPLLLAGCSEEPEPTPKIPDPTSSSPSPTATESETPEAESAEDFIRRWADALQEMQATGETGPFRELGPACESCSETADRVEQIYAAGGAIEWDGWTILSIEENGASDEFRVIERSAPTRFRESSDAPWKRLDGGRTPHVIQLESAGTSWLVVRTAEVSE